MSVSRRRSRPAQRCRLHPLIVLLLAALSSGCSAGPVPESSGPPAPSAAASTVESQAAAESVGPDTDGGPAGVPAAPQAATGAPAPGVSAYPVPANALFVAPDGSDRGPGTERHPLRTVTAAVKAARDGQTVVLRAGSYHESVTIPDGTRITLQPYPEEAVWLDGSRPVTGFVPTGAAFSADWDVRFDHSPTYTWGAPDGHEHGWYFLDARYPLAAHPDQVWLDGQPLRQVGSVEELDAGSFHVDYAAGRLSLGADPAGRSVRASALAKALSIRSEGTVVRGLGIRRYAPSVPHMGAVTVERPDAVLESLTISDNATTGLFLGAADIRASHLTVTGNGMLGVAATYADGLKLQDAAVSGNNRERFRQSPVAGGIKITRSRGVEIRGGLMEDNQGTGLWLDESVRGAAVSGNVFSGNAGHGFSAEISADVELVDNVMNGNSGAGAKVNNCTRVRIWNNTFAGNGRELNIVQDPRRADQPGTPGRDPRHGFDPQVPWTSGPTAVHNNIFAGAGNHCLLCVEDYSRQSSAEDLGMRADGNAYERPGAGAAAPAVLWAGPGGRDRAFATAVDFAAGTGQEQALVQLHGPLVMEGALTALPDVAAQAPGTAWPLPADLAALAGRPPGARHLGAFVSVAEAGGADAGAAVGSGG